MGSDHLALSLENLQEGFFVFKEPLTTDSSNSGVGRRGSVRLAPNRLAWD